MIRGILRSSPYFRSELLRYVDFIFLIRLFHGSLSIGLGVGVGAMADKKTSIVLDKSGLWRVKVELQGIPT
jgi:hypothetical protein